MKLNISLLLSLGQLAAAGRTLGIRDEVKTECFAFDAVDEQTLTFNTYGACASECADAGKPVFAVRASGCFCLDSLPPDDKKAEASECDEPCPGYAMQTCGGRPGYYSVGSVDSSNVDSSNTTDTTSTSTATASSTTSATEFTSSSNVPSNSTSSVNTPSSSASGSSASGSSASGSSASSSSASSSPTVESSSAAAPGLGASFTVMSSFSYAVAALVALI